MAAQEIGSLYIGLGFDTAVFDRQIIQIPQKIKPASDAIERGFGNASKSLDNFNKQSGAVKAGLQNLSFQLNDIATSLASGGSPFRVLAQQGGQVIQVFQQAGFKNIASAIVGMVTPMRALAVGAVAAGVGFAALVVKAQSNAEQLRQFNLILERTGKLATNIDIGGENARLRTLGISASTANAQRLAIARNPQLRASASSEQLQTLGANLGAFSGLGPEAGFQQLQQLISGGPEAAIRFAASLDLIEGKEAGLMIASARLTGGLVEQSKALTLIDKKMRDTAKDAMDPMTKATNTLAGAWDKFKDSLSKTQWVENIRQYHISQLEDFTWMMSDKPDKPTVDWRTERNRMLRGGAGGAGGPAGYPVSSSLEAGGALRGGRSLTREQALAILDPSNPTAPTLGQATQALYTIGGQASVNEGLRAMGMLDDPKSSFRLWKSPEEMAANVKYGSGFLRPAPDAPAAATAGTIAPPRTAQETATVTEQLKRQEEQLAANSAGAKLFGVQQEAALAAAQARLSLGEGAFPSEREAAAIAALAAVYAKYNAELTKDNSITGMRIESERKVAAAMLESEGAAVRLNAAEQARIETLQRGGGSADLRTRQALAARGAGAETSLAQGVVAGKKDIEEAQTRVSLLGESTEYIERQIALLRVRQQVEAAGVPVAQSIVDARIAGVNKLQDELDLLARQRRVMDSIKEVAGVFESAFGRAFDSISDGTFRLRKFLCDLLKDLAKTLASSSFKRLLGGDSSEGGLIGSIAGKLFPSLLGTGIKASSIGGPLGDFGSTDLNKYAGGGSFAVGGSGSIDSQLVAFRATPGEMVQISPANSNYSSGRGEVIDINLNPSEGWVSGIADQRIVTRSGQIIDVAVKQSQRTVQRNFAGMSAEAQTRTA